ncbi:MAG: NAD-dependent epimerase/dehydratase family protein [Opitutus sp.]|nr:NAD-dependent epimerase/dehydratase family protein [Opitutus sp.]MCS6245374.1 NAD-dependent epimerase/dehydratase family protein [Opitutus sp.]MCS6246625.1 NAD-dependent epimerase/dehydratase family protein [Opitutus sp.]MCS6274807.1 NAD-dependent epimerase/dehydratase family protein [Opitutus sp.]MCS6276097.1 NAD-dependent epimerase/dehydratase family protein [Opitutus sp.]
MKSTIIVTGAAGFIGSHTCDCLLAAGHGVVAVDDLSSGRLVNLAEARERPNFVFEQFDLRMPGRFAELVCSTQPAAIIHLAGLVSVQASIRDPGLNFALNLELTQTVAEVARSHAVPRLVFASSAAIYGDAPGLPLVEETLAHPLSPYGAAKAASEHLLLSYSHTYGLIVRCQRYFNVFGPRQDPASPYSGVVTVFLNRMRAGLDPVTFGDGNQSRDFISVQDVARANLLAATQPAVRSGVANICSGRETTLNQLLSILAGVTGFRGAIRREEAKPGDIRRSVGDPRRALAELDFTCEWSLADACAVVAQNSLSAVPRSKAGEPH